MENQERDLQRNSPSDGRAVEQAYQDGIATNGELIFKTYDTYAERIAFRTGWFKVKKQQLTEGK